MPETIPVNPAIIRWAIEQSRVPAEDLARAFRWLEDWKAGSRHPTPRQLEAFAARTMTPYGYFFLDGPPEEPLPIADYRTVDDAPVGRPSPNLLETLHAMQQRQEWMRDFLLEEGTEPLDFVGSVQAGVGTVACAARMRERLSLASDWPESCSNWESALTDLRSAADRIGVLVAVSAVVGLNNHRRLDPAEFRGFVLCDDIAPLVFVNGADAKSAQMFTLAHELAHLWFGRGGLFNLANLMPHGDAIEKRCNEVAAEFLVPREKFRARWDESQREGDPFRKLARWFKVSPLVAARRALDLGLIERNRYFAFYRQQQEEWEKRRAEEKSQRKGGPDFYVVQDVRLGRRFAEAVVRATIEGRLTYRTAWQLTDLRGDTFNQYAQRVTRRIPDERQ